MIQNITISLKNMMTMKMSIKKLLIYFIVVDIILVIGSFFKGYNFFISSQLGFISSLLVTISSYYGYKKMIENKISIGDIPKEDRDELDVIDDKFDLYSNSEEEQKDFKEVIAIERKNIKGFKKSAKNLQKSFIAVISPYRLFSYLFLIISFFYLNNNHLLNVLGFILGISVVSLVSLIVGLKDKP